ncbi:MAG: cytochrome c [Phycisphaerales bacterium]|jgi:hypothetical protein|nr:cytochrome c [Phycisphaerales bacterium]
MPDREERKGNALIALVVVGAIGAAGALAQEDSSESGNAAVDVPTWNDRIGPIIEARCVTCHSPGRSGPFSLATVDDVRNRATFLIDVIKAGRMPPWLPAGGEYRHQRTVPEAEIVAIQAWSKGEAPIGEGPPKILTPPPAEAFRSDLVLEMPVPYSIPEESDPAWHSGELDIHGVNLPLANSGPLRVQAIRHVAAAPQSMRVAAFAFDTTGAGRYLDERDSRVGFLMGGDAGLRPAGADGVVLTGSGDFRLPPGFHLPVESGSDLLVNFQYQPTGKVERLQERVELEFVAETEDSRPARWIPLAVGRIEIDAEEEKGFESAPVVLEEAVDLIGLSPRAIEICSSMQVDAVLPSGSRRTLLSIPDWDHHQRESYVPVRPVRLPAGTSLVASFRLDNTSANPRNPDDPAADIRRGRRTGILNVIAHLAAVDPEFDADLLSLRSRLSGKLIRP